MSDIAAPGVRLIYVALLAVGLVGFVLHLVAQVRVARILRRRYPQQWAIVANPEDGRRSGIRTYARLQQVLRADIPQMFDDGQLAAWHRCWRYAPWVAWPCWIGALALRLL